MLSLLLELLKCCFLLTWTNLLLLCCGGGGNVPTKFAISVEGALPWLGYYHRLPVCILLLALLHCDQHVVPVEVDLYLCSGLDAVVAPHLRRVDLPLLILLLLLLILVESHLEVVCPSRVLHHHLVLVLGRGSLER